MKVNFSLPTSVQLGNDIIQQSSPQWIIGFKALIVTGKHSAIASGALKDITDCLEKEDIKYHLFDEVENNPTIKTCQAGAKVAKAKNCDFIIAIGGGSPLDAAKAIAVLATDVSAQNMVQNSFDTALPVIAVPTTSGTGSEVTCYSVMTREDLGTKLSFGNSYTYPKFALLDPKYTYTVGEKTTIETAIDTFSHLFEGYLSVKSNPITDIIALEGLKKFGEILPYLLKRQFTSDVREKLMYLSLLGGFVLSQTGVTVVHAMGYAYTYHHHTAHGAANGFLMNTYIGYLESIEPGKLAMAMSTIGLARNELKLALDDLLGLPPIIEADILEQYTQETLINQKSVENTLGGLTSKEILNLWQIQSKIN